MALRKYIVNAISAYRVIDYRNDPSAQYSGEWRGFAQSHQVANDQQKTTLT